MLNYPALFSPDEHGGYVVTFRDVPEALTQADTLQQAREMAADALATAMEFYIEDRRPAPMPSRARAGEELVSLPVVVGAKMALLGLMAAERVRPADLARAMGVQPQIVTRLLDCRHKSDIQTVARAFSALGRRLEISVV